MGIYLNPPSDEFVSSRKSKIYIDKSMIISKLNDVIGTEQRYVCISRPRRFGKTMAANMVASYYCSDYDSHELFSGLKILKDPTYEIHRNKYNVIMLDMASFLSDSNSDEFSYPTYKPKNDSLVQRLKFLLTFRITENIRDAYPELELKITDSLDIVLTKAKEYSQKQFVFIIDEWDCIFRVIKEDEDSQKKYLDFLRNLLKNKPYVALAYMTGILPIKKYGEHSALGIFSEYSATEPKRYAEYYGFTEAEVQSVCEDNGMPFSDIKEWYNGYLIKGIGAVYNPKSVVEACQEKECLNYWTKTETFDALRIYIEMNYDGLKDAITKLLAGVREKIDTGHFSNDMKTFESRDDVLTLLIHLGYLGYDSERSEVFIPNKEISMEFVSAMKNRDWGEVIKAVTASEECLEAALRGDSAAVAEHVAAVHRETSHLTYNDENALSYIVSLAFYSSRNYYNIIRELPAGNGFADIAFLPKPKYNDKPAMIIELKWDKSAVTAIDQIKQRNYPAVFEGYTGEIVLVGINYDKQTKTHECVIERV